jgi:CheY-like chemotaxis protein
MAEDAMADRSASLRVLLVEDEMMVALLVQNMLVRCGHTVAGPVARLEKALEMAREEAVDVAILDVNLDGREVYAVADALSLRGIPFIFATGYGKGGLRVAYRDCPTLQKPYREADLRAALAEAVARRT